MGVTEELATFASTLQFDRLPAPVVHEAKRSVLDWFGVALGGSHHEAVDIMDSLLKEMGGNEAATVVGRGSRNSLLFAALLNGQMSHVLDYDDTHLSTITHFSSAMAPAILALGETNRVDGKEFIASFAAGFEVGARVGLAVCPGH
ncbi:MAG: MmgE/PrpD family protein [Dehalococcoidia bacterium]|nr:MmgE/PrpD family protein [Dehalococcoidia bacterium]